MLSPLLAALVVALVALTPAPAQAARWFDVDPAGDVHGWRYDWGVPPCGEVTDVDATTRANSDITGVAVRHTQRRVRILVSFADLDAAREQHVSLHLRGRHGAWMLDVDRVVGRSGEFRVRTFFADEPDWPTPEELAELEAAGECGFGLWSMALPCRIDRTLDPETDVLAVAVPRTCLGNPHQVRVGVATNEFEYAEDPEATWIIGYDDAWGAPDEATPFVPAYGPWVRTP